MKKGCLLSLLLLTSLLGAYYSLTNLYYGYPDNLIGGLVVGFMTFFGIGMLMSARTAGKDLSRLNRHLSGRSPEDGEIIAAVGTVNPVGAPLKAPFSGKECVLYDYRIFTEVQRKESGTAQNVAYSGYAMTLCEIRTASGPIKLLGFPTQENPEKSWIPTAQGLGNARAYIAGTTFEAMDGLKMTKMFSKLKEFLSDDDGVIKEDWKIAKGSVDLSDHNFEEERLDVGQQVCVFGKYSAARGGITADLASGNLNRLIKGSPKTVAKSLKSKITTMLVFGVVFTALSNGALWIAIENAPAVRKDQSK